MVEIVTTTDELLANNARYAEGFDKGGLPAPPGKHVAIVSCMDARLNVYAMFGLTEGEAHVLRNAGGTVTDDVLRSLVLSQRELGTTEIILTHHSRCGMRGLDDAAFAAGLEKETGERPSWTPGGFEDPAADLRTSLKTVLGCAFLPHRDNVRAFLYDEETGRVNELDKS
jgi:carbonic anhydrase